MPPSKRAEKFTGTTPDTTRSKLASAVEPTNTRPRSTRPFITGFPGETDEEFGILLDFLREAQLDRVGCFTYSPVDGARANALPDAVPEEIKQERWNIFMQTQAEISRDRLQRKVGTVQHVLIDEVDEDGAIGRSTADAPEIDGLVHVSDARNLAPGDLVEVLVEQADDYDLFGSVQLRS